MEGGDCAVAEGNEYTEQDTQKPQGKSSSGMKGEHQESQFAVEE